MKIQIKTKLVLILVLFWSIPLLYLFVKADSNTNEIKAGIITISEPTKQGSFFISAKTSTNELVSQIYQTPTQFNSLYIKWENPANTSKNWNLYVRFLNENWSDWIKMEIDDDNQGKDTSSAVLSSQLIPCKITDSFQYKLAIGDDFQKEEMKNLQFVYFDSSKGSKGVFKMSLEQKDDNDLQIISRAEWGANDSYRFDKTGTDLWAEEYYLPQKFVIHHTAGEKANADPMATVRAIQYWHAVGQGWGDIGYNYLIDANGNIYEGRKGGDGVVGGHAYMRNRNTIGIAILGCYQSENTKLKDKESSNCNTPDNLTAATQKALDKLIAVKSREFNIDPSGVTDFHGQMLPNILSHRDVGSTSCPGNLIIQTLPQIRQIASATLKEIGGAQKALATSAEFISQNLKEVKIEEGKTAEIIVEYKNTGQAVWRGYEDAGVFVSDSSVKKQLAAIGTVNIALKKGLPVQNTLVKYQLIGGNVYPGEIGKFKITLKAPQSDSPVAGNFTLAWQNKGYFSNSDFSLTVQKIACISCNSNSTPQAQPVYSATLDQATWPSQMKKGEQKSATLTFKNTGNASWGKAELKLKITTADNQISPFKNSTWVNDYGSIASQEIVIEPNGGIATFNFDLQAPNSPGKFSQLIKLYYQDKELAGTQQYIEILADYSAQITANTIPVAVKKSWRPKVKLTFKNNGSKTWTNLKLKSYDIDYTNSWFKDSSWQDNKTVKQLKKEIKPGDEITFEFKLTPYWKKNTYPQIFKLYDGTNEIYLNGKKELLIYTRVD